MANRAAKAEMKLFQSTPRSVSAANQQRNQARQAGEAVSIHAALSKRGELPVSLISIGTLAFQSTPRSVSAANSDRDQRRGLQRCFNPRRAQ